jgi:hypothetical protein
MQRLRLAFQLKTDDQFIVTVERDAWPSDDSSDFSTQTIYNHEDRFLKLLILADLEDETTRRVVIAVVLAVANPEQSTRWVPVELSLEECVALHLKLPENRPFLISDRKRQNFKATSLPESTTVLALLDGNAMNGRTEAFVRTCSQKRQLLWFGARSRNEITEVQTIPLISPGPADAGDHALEEKST